MPTAPQPARRSIADRNRLVESHLYVARVLAAQMSARVPHTVSFDDLVQAGNIGLIRAAETFDETAGAKFSTYCQGRIRGAMLDYLRDINPQSRGSKARGEPAPQIDRLGERDIGAEPPADPVEFRDEVEKLSRGLDRVGRAIMEYCFVLGMTQADAGKAIGYSEARISQIMSNVRQVARVNSTRR